MSQVHINYEWEKFNKAYKELVTLTVNRDQQRLGELIEIFLLHSRNIFEFLYKGKDYEDDCIAADFIGDTKEYMKTRPRRKELWKSIEKINKSLAHLSYERLRREGPDWSFDIINIHQLLKRAFECFIYYLPSHRKSYFSWVEEVIVEAKSLN